MVGGKRWLTWGYQWLCSLPSRKIPSEIADNEANTPREAEMKTVTERDRGRGRD